MAALTGTFLLLSLRNNRENGRTPSRDMANVTRWKGYIVGFFLLGLCVSPWGMYVCVCM